MIDHSKQEPVDSKHPLKLDHIGWFVTLRDGSTHGPLLHNPDKDWPVGIVRHNDIVSFNLNGQCFRGIESDWDVIAVAPPAATLTVDEQREVRQAFDPIKCKKCNIALCRENDDTITPGVCDRCSENSEPTDVRKLAEDWRDRLTPLERYVWNCFEPQIEFLKKNPEYDKLESGKGYCSTGLQNMWNIIAAGLTRYQSVREKELESKLSKLQKDYENAVGVALDFIGTQPVIAARDNEIAELKEQNAKLRELFTEKAKGLPALIDGLLDQSYDANTSKWAETHLVRIREALGETNQPPERGTDFVNRGVGK